jgi:hypothetical protein
VAETKPCQIAASATAPKHANIFKRQCGVIVRDIVPITTQEWHQPKKAGTEEVTFVQDHVKDLLWDLLMVNFILPPEQDPENPVIAKLVKAFALKKMGQQFKDWKKRLNLKYVQKNKTPDFKGPTEKIKDQWADFVKYKTSEKAKARSAINKKNAALKTHHHGLGSRGYRGIEDLVEKEEAELDLKGVEPETKKTGPNGQSFGSTE